MNWRMLSESVLVGFGVAIASTVLTANSIGMGLWPFVSYLDYKVRRTYDDHVRELWVMLHE